jgi:hypothetical protein
VKAPPVAVFSEPELVDVLRDEPELLAMADAIAETQRPRPGVASFGRAALVGASFAAVIALLLASPWKGDHQPSLVDRALAAVGRGPVIHALIASDTGVRSIEVASGRETPLLATMETWFDERRRIEHNVTRIDGRVQDDTLRTPTGEVASWGSARGGPPPVLDPALAKSVDGYREALASGEARVVGDGSIDGKPVRWLRLTPADGSSERVAIAKDSSEPVRVETTWKSGGSWTYDVRSIGSLPEGSGDFNPPQPPSSPRPQAFMREPTPIAPADAPTVVRGAVALASAFEGLPLTKVVRAKLSTLFEPAANKEPVVSSGLEFEYGSDSLLDGRPYVWISEAKEPSPQYGWRPQLVPSPGNLLVRGAGGPSSHGSTGLMVRNGIYVTINASSRELMLEAARELRPYAGKGK